MKTKAIQICGTGSDVGKSIIVSALCRILRQDGFSVSPFKAQNMALNSFVVGGGGEIGRAQAEQAQAAKISPSVDMNPILLKPNADTKAQVIVHGRAIGNMDAVQYARCKSRLFKKVIASYDRLSKKYNMIIIEGAGSPAEINLKRHDIVNIKMAEYADAGVILVGDIDKGGVFASFIGTLALLDKNERRRVKGFIINKFRGDKRLLRSGLRFLEEKTGKRVLGVIPYFKNIRIAQEDSINLAGRKISKSSSLTVNISVVRLPHLSNFTDFDALLNEKNVNLEYIDNPEDLGFSDVIIIPGTKNTISDSRFLKQSGIAKELLSVIQRKTSVMLVGICGGFQMLGKVIKDPYNIESQEREIKGLGLFDMATTLAKNKQTYQVKAKDLVSGADVVGYEIHHGRTFKFHPFKPAFKIRQRNGKVVDFPDGAQSRNGRIWGTYIHGVFDSNAFRKQLLSRILKLKGVSIPKLNCVDFNRDREFDKLAKVVRDNIDVEYLYKFMNSKRRQEMHKKTEKKCKRSNRRQNNGTVAYRLKCAKTANGLSHFVMYGDAPKNESPV